jgi:trigger factor
LSSTYKIEVNENRVQTQLEKMAASYEDSAGFIRWYHQNPQAMQSIQTLVLEDQVVEWLLERSNKVSMTQSFDAIMKAKSSLDETAADGAQDL